MADDLVEHADRPTVQAAVDDPERGVDGRHQVVGAQHVLEVVVARTVERGVGEPGRVRSRLPGEVADPEDPLAQGVADRRPRRPPVRRRLDRELLLGHRCDGLAQPFVVVRPRAERSPDRSRGHRFAGSERAYVTPRFTHAESARLVATSAAATRSHPSIALPRITIGSAGVVDTSFADCSGSTRTRMPPWPLAATAMLPLTRKASPPNIFFSVRRFSPATSSRIRSARSSSYAMTEQYPASPTHEHPPTQRSAARRIVD